MNDLGLIPSFSSEQRSKRLVNRTPDEKVRSKNVFYILFSKSAVFLSFSSEGNYLTRSGAPLQREPSHSHLFASSAGHMVRSQRKTHGKLMHLSAFDSRILFLFLFLYFFLHIF